MSQRITGIFNILATPFDPALHVDQRSLRNLVEFQLDQGVDGLTILGVLGEAAKLSTDERALVADTVFEAVNGRVPVVVGTSHADLNTCITLSKQAFAAGAAGVMIAPPRLPGATDDDIIALYSRIAAAVDQPIVVQDFPPVNDIIMSAPMLTHRCMSRRMVPPAKPSRSTPFTGAPRSSMLATRPAAGRLQLSG